MSNTDGFFAKLCATAPFSQEEPSAETLAFFNTWARGEGTTARNNPLADTNDAPGATPFNDAGVRDYPSVEVAIEAYAGTFRTVPEYQPIIDAVNSNGPYDTGAVADAIDTWGTHDFATILRSGGALTDDYESPALPASEPTPAPAPTPEPAPAPSAPWPTTTYVVQPGDSEYLIAQRHHMTLGQLEQLNPSSGHPPGDYSVIWPGDVLTVRAAPEAPDAPPLPGYPLLVYVVQHGDTLSGIAAENHMTLAELEQLNPRAGHPPGDYGMIWPGDRILVRA